MEALQGDSSDSIALGPSMGHYGWQELPSHSRHGRKAATNSELKPQWPSDGAEPWGSSPGPGYGLISLWQGLNGDTLSPE